MIKLKDLLNEAKILVYKVNDKKVQKFLKKYPKVEKSMKPFLKGDILRGYNKWLRWKDKNEDKLGGKPNKVDSKSFGSKVFWKHDWNGVSGWAEVFQYLHTLDEGKLKEGIVSGGVKSGGSDAGRDVIKAMTAHTRLGNLSNMTNWLGQYRDSIEFGLKRKMKVGGKVVSIVQIKVTGKDKFTIAYLDWDDGKRPLLTRKIDKNVSAKNLPKELKRNVKVG